MSDLPVYAVGGDGSFDENDEPAVPPMTSPETKSPATFLGYRDASGNEMHCSRETCDECKGPCQYPIAKSPAAQMDVREALKPFADAADHAKWPTAEADNCLVDVSFGLCVGDLRRARAVLREPAVSAGGEPVDWQFKRSDGKWISLNTPNRPDSDIYEYRPLYAALPVSTPPGGEADRTTIAKIINGVAFRPQHMADAELSETDREKWLRARNVAFYQADCILAEVEKSRAVAEIDRATLSAKLEAMCRASVEVYKLEHDEENSNENAIAEKLRLLAERVERERVEGVAARAHNCNPAAE